MPTTYEIDRLADLLRVPIERRTACLREVEYALALHELAFGEKAADVEIGPMRWTDDGDKTCTLHDASGKPVLTLEVTSKSDMQPNAQVHGRPAVPCNGGLEQSINQQTTP